MCPFPHFEVAIGIAEGRDRPATDAFVNTNRLIALVVNKIDFR